MRYDLNGRTVAVTGAGGGLGTALAEALRAEGARVALLDLDADRVQALAARLGDTRTARGWAADVRDLDNLTTVMGEVREHFGSLDVAIAAAGVLGPVTALSAATATDWDRVIEVNLGAPRQRGVLYMLEMCGAPGRATSDHRRPESLGPAGASVPARTSSSVSPRSAGSSPR